MTKGKWKRLTINGVDFGAGENGMRSTPRARAATLRIALDEGGKTAQSIASLLGKDNGTIVQKDEGASDVVQIQMWSGCELEKVTVEEGGIVALTFAFGAYSEQYIRQDSDSDSESESESEGSSESSSSAEE